MSSEEQIHRDDKTGSTHRPAKPASRNPDMQSREQVHPAAIVQRAKIAPDTITSGDVLQLQQAVGNQAVGKLLGGMAKQPQPTQNNSSKTGLPGTLKTGVENLSGLAMDDVQVHYNSDKPAGVQALAFTQGTDIHVAPGQESHLPHEAWHVVQQKQGKVTPSIRVSGNDVNDDSRLETEADAMGTRASQTSAANYLSLPTHTAQQIDRQQASPSDREGVQRLNQSIIQRRISADLFKETTTLPEGKTGKSDAVFASIVSLLEDYENEGSIVTKLNLLQSILATAQSWLNSAASMFSSRRGQVAALVADIPGEIESLRTAATEDTSEAAPRPVAAAPSTGPVVTAPDPAVPHETAPASKPVEAAPSGTSTATASASAASRIVTPAKPATSVVSHEAAPASKPVEAAPSGTSIAAASASSAGVVAAPVAPVAAAPSSTTGLAAPAEISGFAAKAFSYWRANPTKSREEFAQRMVDRLNTKLLHPMRTNIVNQPGGLFGGFVARDFSITVNVAKFSGKTDNKIGALSQGEVGSVVDTLSHEARHAEQVLRVAQMQAGQGKKADRISKDLGIPPEAAAKAAKHPLPSAGSENPAQLAEAQAWEPWMVNEGNVNEYKNLIKSLTGTFQAPSVNMDSVAGYINELVRVKGIFDALTEKKPFEIEISTWIADIKRAYDEYKRESDSLGKPKRGSEEARLKNEHLKPFRHRIYTLAQDAYKAFEHEKDAWAVGGAAGAEFAKFPARKPVRH